jgi:electron transfer flavoprotein alpha subunit
MSVLLIAEHDNLNLKIFTLNAINAASKIDSDIHVLVAGNKCENVAKEVALVPLVKKVLQSQSPNYENYLAENLTPLIVKLSEKYTHIIASANTFGKNLMPRVAALLDISQVSDIIEINGPDTFIRPIYAGNAFATVQSLDSKKVITVRATGFDAVSTDGNADIITLDSATDAGISSHVNDEFTVSERPDLGAAGVVISGGRGMQNGDNFKLLDGIADKLGAAIGASRAAVDAGFVPNDMQVGQTGKIVAPNLYIAVGISGAIQHLAGMKDSKIIVAINKDPDAPIFQVADYGLVADLFDVLPDLEQAL